MSLDSLRACVHHMDEATSNLDDASLSLSSLVRRTHSNLRPRPQNQPYYRRRIMVQKELSSLVANELDMRQMELRHLFNELETIIANNLAKKKKLSLELRRKSQDLRKDLEHLTETEQFQHEESFAKVQVEHDNLTKLIEKTQNCLSQLREDEEKLMLEISDLEDQAAKEAAIIESSLKLDLKGELKQSDPVLQLTCIWEKLLAKRDQEKERLKDVLKEQKVRLQEIKNMEDENARERKRKITELEKQERSQEDMLRERKKLKMAISLAMNERNQLRDEKSGSELLSDDAIIEQATGEVNSQYATMQDTLKQIESRVASCESENALRKSRVVSLLKMDDSLGLNAGQKVSKMSIGAVGQILMRVLGGNIELSSLNEDERKVLEGEKTTLDYLEQMGIIDTSNDRFIKIKK